MKIIKILQDVSHSHWYWLAYISGGLSLLAAALFYQYQLEELPCVVCIQVRLWISLIVIVSIAGLLFRKMAWLNAGLQIIILLSVIGLAERSYLLLGTERGFIFGDCGFDAGLPAWFAIEQWLPWMYQVETSCGYTPEIIFGVTMAEALMLLSAGLTLFSLSIVLVTIKEIISNKT
ncbi:MAG: disulfide bond formation protein B [endosymbiont of Galathealinum brachiosum]|uniref:Disulfide bond formation protein B n=1 Tax=endosymbiont of Galathealinum brachiosum TaxID=2200906 RepID=A0A370DKQ9_9GAMM|nr:MAG: disulfide bond formation protein B [endosymbiont of Galathealinum brachiosum]